MKTALLTILLMIPTLVSAQAYKCTVGGVAKYQAAPCQTDPDAAPLALKTPSEELQAKMREQERARDQHWANIQKAEAEKQQAAAAAREERDRIAYERELERERQVINARRDLLWNEHVQDRATYEQNRREYDCTKMKAQGRQTTGC